MLLIVAALAEELHVALDLCSRHTKIECGGVRVWQAARGRATVFLAKTGAGPTRSARRLQRILSGLQPANILIIGYAGALDPSLKLGDIAVIREAAALGDENAPRPRLEEARLSGTWELAKSSELFNLARGAGLTAHCGRSLTSPCVIGNPAQKQFLHARFQASVIDMETAALARIASAQGIPVSCVRAVTDDAKDELLAVFSYNLKSAPINQAFKAVSAGNWIRRYHEWRARARIARESLRKFLIHYLDGLPDCNL